MSSPYNSRNPAFVIKTLGCKVNQYESQAMRENLTKYGFVEKKDGQIADYYLINSCTVTHHADRRTRSLISHFHRINPNGKVVIAGCYAELDSDRARLMSIPGVAHLIRNSEKEKIGEMLTKIRNQKSEVRSQIITDFKDRNRAFVKVQDGCNLRCSYCKVSLVRGTSRSRSIEEVLTEIKELLEKGFKEIVLTGVCLGSWSRDFPLKMGPPWAEKKKMDLADLVKSISCLKGRFRIRLSSIEPMHVTDAIINVLKVEDKVCKHLHIALQSGDDKILKVMNRLYTTKEFRQIIQKIRKEIPDVAITTDVLVGFPWEGDKQFLNTLKFIEDIRPSRIHVFSYSRREGTPAAKYSHNLDTKRIKSRVKDLRELGRTLSMDFAKGFIGKTQNAIIESYRDKTCGYLTGYTGRYIRVFVDGADSLKNTLIPVKITSVDEEGNAVFALPAM